jgi:hypothetical protein
MAYTKKNATTKKTETTSKVAENIENADIPVAEEIKKPSDVDTSDILSVINDNVDKVSNTDNVKATSRTTEVTIANEEEIAVRSITFGGLTWISPRTNAHFRWNEIGAVEYIPFGELITMNNTKRQFLFNPLVIVQDERVVKYFRLQPVYEKVAQINNLEKIFNSGNRDEVEKVLKTILDVNMRDVAISRIRAMRKNGTLTNIDVIHMIEKILCFDLSNEE